MSTTRTSSKGSRAGRRERLEARITLEQKELLQLAADLQGRTLSDFVVDSAQRAAEEAIRAHSVITLTAQDSRAFAEALLHPPSANEQIRAAAARYHEAVEER